MTSELSTNVAATIIPDGSFNTVDMTDFDGAMRVTNAINNSTSLNDFVSDNPDAVLTVVDIVVTPGTRKGRNGMPDAPCDDTRLILADGTSLMTQSSGIARSARFIAGLCGAQLHDGLLIKVHEQKLNNGNSIKTLELVGKA